MIKSPRFKIGDKIRYIGTQNHPSKTEIFTVKGVETEGSEYRYTVEESSNWWFAEHIIDIVLTGICVGCKFRCKHQNKSICAFKEV